MYFLVVSLSLFFFTFPALAQNSKSLLEVGAPTAAIEMEAQVQRGLPELIRGIEEAVAELKKNEIEASKNTVDQTRNNLDALLQGLQRIPGDEEREIGFQRIDAALDEASYALGSQHKAAAMVDLTRAYRLAKALSQSPVLKLTATKVSLHLAGQQIQVRNYSAAGSYLERAIDGMTAIQDDPNVDQQEIRSLKNAIVLAHQQVILGQQADGTYMDRLYQRATTATSNALFQYYNMWTRTPTPWDQNE